jgi:DNA-binding transcriptional regulator YiaG
MSQHQWSPAWIRCLRRTVLRENTRFFAAHWVYEDGKEISPRTVEAWEQGRRRPPLYVRRHMSRVLYRLNRKGANIQMPTQTP